MFVCNRIAVTALIFLTMVMLSPAYAVAEPFDELKLVDIQPEIGGQRFIIKNNGEYELKIVKPSRSGQNDQEYTGFLGLKEFKKIKQVLKSAHFTDIKLPAKKADDSSKGPIVELIHEGNVIRKQKLTGIKHRRFDEVYGTLLAIINQIVKKKRNQPSESDVPVLP